MEFFGDVLASLSSEIIVGLIVTTILGAVAIGRKAIANKKLKRIEEENRRVLEHKRGIMEGLSSYVVTTEDLRDLCTKTGAIRAMIVQLHNGGDRPQLGNTLKATVVAEWAPEGHRLMAPIWQGVVVGADYILSVVKPILESESIYLKADSMREGSALKDHYTASGVVGSKIVLLGVNSDTESTFLISCHFAEHPGVDEKFRSAYRERAWAIKNKLDLV